MLSTTFLLSVSEKNKSFDWSFSSLWKWSEGGLLRDPWRVTTWEDEGRGI